MCTNPPGKSTPLPPVPSPPPSPPPRVSVRVVGNNNDADGDDEEEEKGAVEGPVGVNKRAIRWREMREQKGD